MDNLTGEQRAEVEEVLRKHQLDCFKELNQKGYRGILNIDIKNVNTHKQKCQ